MTVFSTADFLKSSFVEYPAEGTVEQVVCQMPESTDKVVAKKSSSKKVCIIGVITGFIVLALATAAVIGVYLLLDRAQAVQYHLEVTLNDKSSLKQETTHYVTDDVVQQHIASDNGSDIWILSDFSRNIQIMRMQPDDSSSPAHCYVTPLNRTSAVAMPPASSDINATELIMGRVMQPTSMSSVRYVPSPYPITDTSVLGSRGQELCSGLNTFWAWPMYDDARANLVDASSVSVAPTVSTLSRKRRQSQDVYSWCWALQCQTMYIGSYYTTPRAFTCCNRQYRCPCTIAVNDPTSTVPSTTTTTSASAVQNDPIIAQYIFKKNSITV